MDPPPPDFRLLRFSTARVPSRERLHAWEAVLAQKLIRFAVEPQGKAAVRIDVMMRTQHGVRIATGSISPSIHTRSREMAQAERNNDVGLLVALEGRIKVSQRNREGILRPGDAFAFNCTEDVTLTTEAPVRVFFIRLPYAALARHASAQERTASWIVPAETSAVKLLVHYGAALFEDDDIAMAPGSGRVVIDHLVDLVALSLMSARGTAAFITTRGARSNQLKAIKADVLRNLTFRGVSIGWAAARHNVSRRQLYRLFERSGTTFMGFLLEHRLAAVRRMLLNPRFADHGIAEIAMQCGFDDVSYFNRVFRQRYGTTPSTVRRARRS